MLAVPPGRFAAWGHQDLQHRLKHFGIPVVAVGPGSPS
jgi:hypothetical protein